MARIRSIHARFALDEDLAALPVHIQLAHAYLPCHFDKAGRHEDKSKTLRALVFPYRQDIDMEDVIAKLAEIGKVIRYERDGKRYLQWVDFAEIHHPHHSEQASKIPAPLDNGASTVHTPGINGVPSATAPSEPAPSLVSGVLSLVDGGESRESQGERPRALSAEPRTEQTQTGIVDELLPQLPVLYLEVKRVPFSGNVEKFRGAATEAIGTRPLSHLDRCVRIVRYGLRVAGPSRAFPMDREGFPNLFRNWSAFEESAVRNDIITPIDPDTGEPEPEWTDACRTLNHPRLCLSRKHCEDRQRQDRQRQEREQREAERAAAVEAAGGEEAFEAQQAAMRKEIWERARGAAKAVSA